MPDWTPELARQRCGSCGCFGGGASSVEYDNMTSMSEAMLLLWMPLEMGRSTVFVALITWGQ